MARKVQYYEKAFVKTLAKALQKRKISNVKSVVASVGREGTPSHRLVLVDVYGLRQVLNVVRCRDSRDVERLAKKLKS